MVARIKIQSADKLLNYSLTCFQQLWEIISVKPCHSEVSISYKVLSIQSLIIFWKIQKRDF